MKNMHVLENIKMNIKCSKIYLNKHIIYIYNTSLIGSCVILERKNIDLFKNFNLNFSVNYITISFLKSEEQPIFNGDDIT